MGYQRAGWYSYDRLEAMQGIADFVDGGSARRIIPELQSLTVGDVIPMDPYGGLTVEVLEPNRALVLHRTMSVRDASPVDLSQPDPGPHINFVWAFVLELLGDGSTRLIIRSRADYQPRAWLAAFFLLFEPVVFVMERKMLLGIGERAEKAMQ